MCLDFIGNLLLNKKKYNQRIDMKFCVKMLERSENVEGGFWWIHKKQKSIYKRYNTLIKVINDKNVEAVKKVIVVNHLIIIREIVEDVWISFGSCHVIFWAWNLL